LKYIIRLIVKLPAGEVKVLEEQYHLPRSEALAFASLAVDLHVSQIVNGGMIGTSGKFFGEENAL
jgi:acetamidase/formamidase